MDVVPRWAVALVAAWLSLACGPATAATAAPDWRWPLEPRPPVVAFFDAPDGPYAAGHRGVDLLGFAGQPVTSVAAGHVTFAGSVAGRGVVVVDHGGVRSTYEPVVARVRAGDRIEAGQRLGTLTGTASHCLPSACLHLGAKTVDGYLDPLRLLGGGPIRLKPLAGDPVDAALGPTTPSGPPVGGGSAAASVWLASAATAGLAVGAQG